MVLGGSPGNEIGSREGAHLPADLTLPRFIQKSAAGLFVDLSYLGDSSAFYDFAENLFSRSFLFRGLDYPVFLRLAFDFFPATLAEEIYACEAAGRRPVLRFAHSIGAFNPERFSLYRSVKVSGGKVDYLFEPLWLERTRDEPVYETEEDGEQRVLRVESAVVREPAQLDFDEFVAQMWVKGVRFGLQDDVVRKAIAESYAGRLTVGCETPAGAGRDAGVEELADCLRRSDAPDRTESGKVNLARFQNRFPQVRAGVRLLRKIPLALGTPGRRVDGALLAPGVPSDLDFDAVSGDGTVIERDSTGEFLVTTMDGFLDIDTGTNKVSVTEKMINRDGVSMRTTGDLSLKGEEYEEHGEIQEGRTVEGFNITACADVFGKLVSTGGTITIRHNLTGGFALNRAGTVVVEGRASGALVFAPGGEVRVNRAEGCVIVARHVMVSECAVGCDIFADVVEIARAEGGAIGGTELRIASVGARKQNETLVSVLLPALGESEAGIASAKAKLIELDEADADAKEQSDELQAQPDLARFIAITGKVRRKEVVLNEAQQAALHKMRQQVAPLLRHLSLLAEAVKANAEIRRDILAELERIEAACLKARQSVSCSIAEVTGGVIVRALPQPAGIRGVFGMAPPELKQFLRSTPPGAQMLFADASGSFEWTLSPATPSEAPDA